MSSGISITQHCLHPFPKEASCTQKAIIVISSLAIGAVIGYLGSLYVWYLGVALGGVGTLSSFYLLSAAAKKCMVSEAKAAKEPQHKHTTRQETVSQQKILSSERHYFPFHEKQSLRAGLCGKHAINNAFGEEVEGGDVGYINKVAEYITKETTLTLSLVDPYDFGSDVAIVQHILAIGPKRIETKQGKISELPGFKEDKSAALEKYVGKADWVIVANTGTLKPFYSKGAASHSIAAGHMFAGRKDEEGNWWFLDSRYDFQVDIPLNYLDDNFTLIVPTQPGY